MRHALVAEQRRSESNLKIKQLTAECEKLEDLVDQLNQDEVDKKKLDDEERTNLKEAHQKFKDEMAQKIFELKD